MSFVKDIIFFLNMDNCFLLTLLRMELLRNNTHIFKALIYQIVFQKELCQFAISRV